MKKILILIVLISIFVLSGCGRDTSSPEKALIGHWDDDNFDYYYSADRVYSTVKKDAAPEAKESYKEIKNGLEYKVLSLDKDKRTLMIKSVSQNKDIVNYALKIQFNSDYTEVKTTVNKKHSDFPKEWEDGISSMTQKDFDELANSLKYVDDKTKPNK